MSIALSRSPRRATDRLDRGWLPLAQSRGTTVIVSDELGEIEHVHLQVVRRPVNKPVACRDAPKSRRSPDHPGLLALTRRSFTVNAGSDVLPLVTGRRASGKVETSIEESRELPGRFASLAEPVTDCDLKVDVHVE